MSQTAAPPSAHKHPRGLYVLFFTEMWERFGFYLLIGILSLYMLDDKTGGFGFDKALTAEIYGTFIALVYLTPFLGGVLADRWLGYRRSVIIGALLMAAGYLTIAVPTLPAFYTGLGLVVLGNGFFKPNISTIVGRLYPAGSPLRDAGYNIFYMGINVGAFACNFVAAILRNHLGWGYAFAAAGVGMLIGLVTFVLGGRALGPAAERDTGAGAVEPGVVLRLTLEVLLPAGVAGAVGYFFLGDLFGSASTAAFIAAVIPVVVYYALVYIRSPKAEKGPIGALLAIFSVVVVFWMVFHQNGSSLTYWAEENTVREAGSLSGFLRTFEFHQEVAGDHPYWHNVPAAERPPGASETTLISTELFQSINPFFVVTLTPLVVWFFRFLRRRRKEPSTPAKIAWGLAVTALSTLFMIGAVLATHGGATKASPLWLVGTYGVITLGELFLSPMGLALVSRMSPRRVTAVMMGGWFLATAIGNKLAGVLAGFWESVPLIGIFGINCGSALVAALAIALLTPWIRRVMTAAGH